MTLYATFNTDGSIATLQRGPFEGSEPIGTDTSSAYAEWFNGLPSFITDGWPAPGGA
jgi:hypothetical protein